MEAMSERKQAEAFSKDLESLIEFDLSYWTVIGILTAKAIDMADESRTKQKNADN